MSEPLVTYLEDHLAGAACAIDLLEAMQDRHQGEPLGHFAAGILVDVKADYQVLEDFAKRIGTGSAGLKVLSAWMAEKVSRLKLRRSENGLGTFEALEFLVLGIQGKLALWRALTVAAENNDRFRELNLDQLIARAEAQRARVEEQRLAAARNLFGTSSAPGLCQDYDGASHC